MFKNLIRLWLLAFLIFLPFQHRIVKGIELWSKELSAFIDRLDGITIVIFLLLAIREFYKNREILNRFHLILLSPILALSIFGFLSGIVNGNSLFITIYGIFDYVRNFLVIFIYAAFFRESRDFKKIFRLLLIVAVFLGVVALIQEFWALSSRYILEKDINERAIYVLRYIPLDPQSFNFKSYWRLGIYRAPSMMPHPNGYGLYSLLFLTLYLFIKKKVNLVVFIALLSGVFGSVSRKAYTGFMVLAGLQIFRGRRWLIPLVVIPIAILLISISPLSEFDMTEGQKKAGVETHREYTRHKAIEIWKDHPLWGVGPGKFGGNVAMKTKAHVYEEYNFSRIAKTNLKNIGTIDQFWPQVLAEMGIIGTVAFAGLFISLFIGLFILKQQADIDEMKGLFTGLIIFTVIILIYSSGTVLNVIPVLFTYSAFAGMGLGCSNKHMDNN